MFSSVLVVAPSWSFVIKSDDADRSRSNVISFYCVHEALNIQSRSERSCRYTDRVNGIGSSP
jgi:hypothetical protein